MKKDLQPIEYTEIIAEIEWDAAPEIKSYVSIHPEQVNGRVLLENYKSKEIITMISDSGNSRIITNTYVYTKIGNQDFSLWWYTPYCFYRMIMFLLNRPPDSFASWDQSPVPNAVDRSIILICIFLAIGVIIGMYMYAKHKSKSSIVLRQDLFKNTLNQNKQLLPPNFDPEKKWEEIGLHRQINSFFLNFITILVFNMPYIFIVVGVYYRYIQPFPMVQGMYSWLGGIFGSVFLILELEVGTAMKKYFAETRIHSASEALKYAQIYVWFQLFLATIQLFVIGIIGLFIVPKSYVSYMSFFVIFQAIARFPGCYGAISMVFHGLQRFDINIKLGAYLGTILNNIIIYIVILICRNYFASVPRFGEAFGAAIGVVLGGYIASVVNFIIYIFIYTRMGYFLGNLFRIDFSMQHLKKIIGFGGKLTIGNAWRGIAGVAETVLISIFVLSYSSGLGYTGLVGNLTSILNVLSTFLGALMPAISESFGNNKKKLTEYYLVEGLRWINFFVFFVTAVLFATGSLLIALAGGQWAEALKFVSIQIFFALWWPLAWYVDAVFQGTGHTGYNTFVWIIEQGTRVLLLFLLLPIYQLWGIYYAYIPGIILKGVIALILIQRKVLRFDFHIRHTTIIPFISATLIFGLLYGLIQILPANNIPINILLIIGGFLVGFLLHGFLTGLFGGWDENTLNELLKGLKMVRSTEKVFMGFYKITKLGNQISPWKSTDLKILFEQAQAEAGELSNINSNRNELT
jgi:O-antigen/teichoic acid export membrane protein